MTKPQILLAAIFLVLVAADEDRFGGAEMGIKEKILDYERRAKEVDPKDAEAHYQLGLWCLKNGLAPFAPARREFEKVLALNPDHAGARKALDWKKEGGAWVKDYAPFAAGISVVTDMPDDDPFVKTLKDPQTWIAMLKEIDERTGLRRFATEMTVTCHYLKQGKTAGLAMIGEYGDGEKPYRFNIYTKVPVAKVVQHELTHALTWPAWQSTPVWPRWLLEGLPTYAADQFYRVKDIKEMTKIGEGTYAGWALYGRGFLFFKYLEEKHGAEKLRQFIRAIAFEEQPFQTAVTSATGLDWEALRTAEFHFAKAAHEQALQAPKSK